MLSAAALVLAACSLSPAITEHSIDYNEAFENVANSLLVVNILRAKDGAPLYFSDLSQIRGSLQLNLQVAQTTIPYAHFFGSTTPSTFQGGPLTAGSSPGFDFAPLNTKKFAQGVLAGLDPKIFAYLMERETLDKKLLLNLMIARIEIYRKTGPDKFGPAAPPCVGRCVAAHVAHWTQFPDRGPLIGRVSKETNLGPPIPADILARENNLLRNLVDVDAQELDLNELKGGSSYRLSKSETKLVLCAATGSGNYRAIGIAAPGVTGDVKELPVPPNNGTCRGPVEPYRWVLFTRSVEAIFYYLGALLRDSPENPPFRFFIYDYPVEGARFHTAYRGKTYYVRNSGLDDTLTVLAILDGLLDLSREADEIPSTKTVATSP